MNSNNAGKVFLAMWTFVVLDGHAFVLLLHVGPQIGRLSKSEINNNSSFLKIFLNVKSD